MINKSVDSIIRVNQAGEIGAKMIYRGQLDFIRNPKIKEIIQEMALDEEKHLEYFNQEIIKRKIRPTILSPLWNVAGYTLGAVTAILGDKAAMACTSMIEEVIGNHYQRQLDILPDDQEEDLKKNITIFRNEELEHKDTAIYNNAKQLPLYKIIDKFINIGSKTSIWLSERF